MQESRSEKNAKFHSSAGIGKYNRNNWLLAAVQEYWVMLIICG